MLGTQEPFCKHVLNAFSVQFLTGFTWNTTMGVFFPKYKSERVPFLLRTFEDETKAWPGTGATVPTCSHFSLCPEHP